jgi:hypothetical protein
MVNECSKDRQPIRTVLTPHHPQHALGAALPMLNFASAKKSTGGGIAQNP